MGAARDSGDDGPLRLVVLGDSTAFTDDVGPQLPWVDHLYPNVVARRLEAELAREVAVQVVARPGWLVRDALRALQKDRHVQFEVLHGADAVVVGLGSFDNAPGGIPAAVDALVPYVRPAPVRRRLRRALTAAYPLAVRATAGRRRRTPPREFERLFDQLLVQVRGLTQGVPGVVVGPTSHRSDFYAHVHPRHREAEAHQFEIATRHGFATVSCWDHAEPMADRLNPDGIHWPPAVHAAIGEEVAAGLLAQLTGQAPPPGVPW